MREDRAPPPSTAVDVKPLTTEIVVYEGDGPRMVLIGPPLTDMHKIEDLKTKNFSISEQAAHTWPELNRGFANELDRKLRRLERHRTSLTFLTRLANLAELSGDHQRQLGFLNEAAAISQEPAIKNKIANALVVQERLNDAEKALDFPGADEDINSLVKLAYIAAARGHFERAEQLLEKCLAIDPFSASARLFRGALNLRKSQYEWAIHDFKIASEERPTSSAIFGNLGAAYAYSGSAEKAIAALRRAVVLDPLNKNALALLSDILFMTNRAQEVRGHLKYYLDYEQKDATMWERMARVYLETREHDKALHALRRQGSIQLTATVWNNIGVAYARMPNKKARLEAFRTFRQAIATEDGEPEVRLLAARNLIAFLNENRMFRAAAQVAGIAISSDRDQVLLTKDRLGEIYSLRIHALHKGGRAKDAEREAQQVLRIARPSSLLRAWVVTHLVGHLALADRRHDALALADEGLSMLERDEVDDRSQCLALANNVFFAYSEFAQLDKASRVIPWLDAVFHDSPYPTASLGLFHMRKGHTERGTKLYNDAIMLATRLSDKARIRQKLWLEQAKLFLSTDPRKAERLLSRVVREEGGEDLLVVQAQGMLKMLVAKFPRLDFSDPKDE